MRCYLRVCALILCAVCLSNVASAQTAPAIARQGDHFTVDGQPKFLLFISYFDAMRRSNAGGSNTGDIDTDLQFIKNSGYDGIRIMPNWWSYACSGGTTTVSPANDTLFTSGSSLRSGKLAVFKRVLDRAEAYGLLVEVAFTRETVTSLSSVTNYKDQIALVASELSNGYPGVLFDLQNEFYGGSGGPQQELTDAEVKSIADAVKAYDTATVKRLVTVSPGGGYYTKAGSISSYAELTYAAPHLPGPGGTWYNTTALGNAIASVRAGFGSAPYPPVHWNETPKFSQLYYSQPGTCAPTEGNANDFIAAAQSAKLTGAAGYTFHTQRTFDLDGATYLSKLKSGGSCISGVAECTVVPAVWNDSKNTYWKFGFTDPSLNAGAPVKTVHIIELRARINGLRVASGLSPYSWTDATLIPGVTLVKRAHLTELRTALDQVYAHRSLTHPAYTDTTITTATTIKVVHITELRTFVTTIE